MKTTAGLPDKQGSYRDINMKRQIRFGVGHTNLYFVYRRRKKNVNRKKVRNDKKNQKIGKVF
jgi:hypothetical protein